MSDDFEFIIRSLWKEKKDEDKDANKQKENLQEWKNIVVTLNLPLVILEKNEED